MRKDAYAIFTNGEFGNCSMPPRRMASPRSIASCSRCGAYGCGVGMGVGMGVVAGVGMGMGRGGFGVDQGLMDS
eukprot:178499-Chlamydomonas_euryale.AAC.1